KKDKDNLIKQELLNKCSKYPNKLADIKNYIDKIGERNKNSNNKETKDILEVVKKFNDEIKYAEMAIDLYSVYQQDKEKLDVVKNSIEQAEAEIKQLNHSLKDIKRKIQKISKGFEIQEEITDYIENLNQAIATLINIHD
ncbi:15358_t:CDS:2, partial [Racocetra persica]